MISQIHSKFQKYLYLIKLTIKPSKLEKPSWKIVWYYDNANQQVEFSIPFRYCTIWCLVLDDNKLSQLGLHGFFSWDYQL